MATTAYCTISDVQNRLSADGVTYRADDTPPTSYGDVLDEASRILDEYLLLQYSEANLALSRVVKHMAANIAAHLLCERRGNPVPRGIAAKFERTMESLEKYGAGTRVLPDIPQRRAGAPVLSNVRIRLDPFPRTVVEKNRSTGPTPDYTQHSDRLDYLDYSI